MKCFNCHSVLKPDEIERMKRDAKKYNVSFKDIVEICNDCNRARNECHQRELEHQSFDPYYGY